MKIETILNALVLALVYVRNEWWTGDKEKYDRRNRQQVAFRARILRICRNNWRFAWEASELRGGELQRQLFTERELHELEIAEKDAAIDEAYLQIAQLMELARIVDRLRKHRMNSDYLIVLDLAPKILKEWDK